MKTIEKEFFLQTNYPIDRLGADQPLFIDIETTGLSSERMLGLPPMADRVPTGREAAFGAGDRFLPGFFLSDSF